MDQSTETEVENLKRLLLSVVDDNVKLGLAIWQYNPAFATAFSKRDRQRMYHRIQNSKALVVYCLESDFLEPIQRIKKLDLMSCDLKGLPVCVTRLPHLEELDIRSNQLREVPEVVGKLKNLKTLKLGINALRYIPEEVFQLTNLTYLCFCNNPDLKLDVDSPITQLVNIETLCISKDQLSKKLKNTLKESRPQIVFT
jgi:Leucine-rich repeat (LRR) protein